MTENNRSQWKTTASDRENDSSLFPSLHRALVPSFSSYQYQHILYIKTLTEGGHTTSCAQHARLLFLRTDGSEWPKITGITCPNNMQYKNIYLKVFRKIWPWPWAHWGRMTKICSLKWFDINNGWRRHEEYRESFNIDNNRFCFSHRTLTAGKIKMYLQRINIL